MIDKDDYNRRIAQASTAQLVVITLELTLAFISEALAVDAKKNTEEFQTQIDKAKNALMQLIKGLDFTIPLAQDFYGIYQYVYKLLTDAYFKKSQEPAKEASELLETLLKGWREAEKVEAAAAPIVEQQIYAGLTYQRGGLAEYVVEDENRGYQA